MPTPVRHSSGAQDDGCLVASAYEKEPLSERYESPTQPVSEGCVEKPADHGTGVEGQEEQEEPCGRALVPPLPIGSGAPVTGGYSSGQQMSSAAMAQEARLHSVSDEDIANRSFRLL